VAGNGVENVVIWDPSLHLGDRTGKDIDSAPIQRPGTAGTAGSAALSSKQFLEWRLQPSTAQ
jgi:hypothetical protein